MNHFVRNNLGPFYIQMLVPDTLRTAGMAGIFFLSDKLLRQGTRDIREEQFQISTCTSVHFLALFENLKCV
jgi:hypothetical protein